MSIFLKLKHWQMFLIWLGGSIQMQAFMKTDLWFVSFAIYFGLIYGWIYAIGAVLNERNPMVKRKLNIWSLVYLISIVPFAIKFRNMMTQSFGRINILILIVGGIVGLISIINVALISSKSLKEREKRGKLTFGNYALEFFLILYMIIGVWILQPKLNKIVNTEGGTINKNSY